MCTMGGQDAPHLAVAEESGQARRIQSPRPLHGKHPVEWRPAAGPIRGGAWTAGSCFLHRRLN